VAGSGTAVELNRVMTPVVELLPTVSPSRRLASVADAVPSRLGKAVGKAVELGEVGGGPAVGRPAGDRRPGRDDQIEEQVARAGPVQERRLEGDEEVEVGNTGVEQSAGRGEGDRATEHGGRVRAGVGGQVAVQPVREVGVGVPRRGGQLDDEVGDREHAADVGQERALLRAEGDVRDRLHGGTTAAKNEDE